LNRYWFPDTSVLCNFAAIARTDLLKAEFVGRGRWTAAVAYEAERSTAFLADLQRVIEEVWLGEPVETTEAEAAMVERIRIAAFGGTPDRPFQHLGEAETCHVLRTRAEFSESVWMTDDVAAYDYGRRARLTTWSTRTLVEHLITNGDLTAQSGYELLEQMVDAGRYVHRMPGSRNELA
jgi:hypothetical protein